MNYLSNSIADFYIKRKIIDPEDKEVYRCGIELILNDVVTFSIIIIMSCFIGSIRFSFEFLSTFCITRVFCGGYHAKKAYICRTAMLITFCLVIAFSFFIKNIYILLSILIASFIIILVLAPVRHPNKKLTQEKRRENRKKGIISSILFTTAAILIFLLVNKHDGVIISLSLMAVSVFAVLGAITNERGI